MDFRKSWWKLVLNMWHGQLGKRNSFPLLLLSRLHILHLKRKEKYVGLIQSEIGGGLQFDVADAVYNSKHFDGFLLFTWLPSLGAQGVAELQDKIWALIRDGTIKPEAGTPAFPCTQTDCPFILMPGACV